MNQWRYKVFQLIERSDGTYRPSRIYDSLMIVLIFVSILPLMFVNQYPVFRWTELITVSIFILDYLMRWMTADYKMGKGVLSFVVYPFTFMAIIDFLSIVPAFHLIGGGFKLLRMTRLFRVLRVFKIIRYTDKIQLLTKVINKERKVLSAVLVVAAFYVFVTALIMFNVEPQINPVTGSPTFKSFFDALYWATVTLTTVGYGDVCPVTSTGRFVSMLSSIFGVAIIALPSGILTASYLDELRSNRAGRQSGDTPVQEVKEVEESSNNKKRFVSLKTGNKSLRNMKDHLIVTISRELGSGGRTVGRKLAEQLGVRYSDKDLVNALRKKFNLTTSHIEELKGEKKNWLSDLIKWVAPMPKEKQLVDVDSKFIQEFRSEVTSDDVFKAETEILKGIADEGSCVIAGRSGFFVLKDYPDKVDIFITAPRKNRIARVMRKQNLTEDQAAAVIDSVDASRENYIKRYTGTSRYDARNYDLVINMDGLTEDEAVALILAYIKDENTGA